MHTNGITGTDYQTKTRGEGVVAVRNQCKKKYPHHRRFTHQSISQSIGIPRVCVVFRFVSLHFRRYSLRGGGPPPPPPREQLVVMGHLYWSTWCRRLLVWYRPRRCGLRWCAFVVGMGFCWFPGMWVGASGVIVLCWFLEFFLFFSFPPSPPHSRVDGRAGRVRAC
ncbi:hypothetical protein B9Z19DRAFT_1075064, partial [Tuber borchii]